MKTLLIRPGGIGDCILSFPALERLALEDTEIWAPSPIVPLLAFASRARALSSTGLDLLEIPGADASQVVTRLRSFDAIVSWYGSNREEFHDAAARHGLPIRFLAALPPDSASLHAADFFLAQAGGAPPAIPRLRIAPRPGAGGIYIHPYSGSPRKNWPLDRFREAAALLPQPVTWLRGDDDPPLAEAAPPVALDELAARLAGARLYLGNDSGITHLAAAAGAPVVALFGPTDPAVWGPRGPRVQIVQARALDDLMPGDVFAACERLLA